MLKPYVYLHFFRESIDLLAILRKSLDRAEFLHIFMREVRLSGVRASIAVAHIRKFFKMYENIVRFRFSFRKHRFQIFKRVGVKFNEVFLSAEWLQIKFSYFAIILPLDFSKIFNIVGIRVFSSFS